MKQNRVIPTSPKEDEAFQEFMKEKLLVCAKNIVISIPMTKSSRDMNYYKKTKREINF